MKTTIKLLLALAVILSAGCSEDSEGLASSLKGTAWLAERVELKNGDNYGETDFEPYWIQFTDGQFMALPVEGNYKIDKKAGTLSINNGEPYKYRITNNKMIWEAGIMRITFKKVNPPNSKLLKGDWKIFSAEYFNKGTHEWRYIDPIPYSEVTFSSSTEGALNGTPFTYKLIGNVITFTPGDKKIFITELTLAKCTYIEFDNNTKKINKIEWRRKK